MLKVEELRTLAEYLAEYPVTPMGVAEMVRVQERKAIATGKILLAAIEDAQRYKKDENGLLSCPFCGGKAESSDGSPYATGCPLPRCNIRSPLFGNIEQAIHWWNTRTIPAAVRAVLEVTGQKDEV